MVSIWSFVDIKDSSMVENRTSGVIWMKTQERSVAKSCSFCNLQFFHSFWSYDQDARQHLVTVIGHIFTCIPILFLQDFAYCRMCFKISFWLIYAHELIFLPERVAEILKRPKVGFIYWCTFVRFSLKHFLTSKCNQVGSSHPSVLCALETIITPKFDFTIFFLSRDPWV